MPSETPRLRTLFRGQVTTDGTLIISEQSRWRGWLARHRNRVITVAVEPEYQPRSTRGNRYYWGVCLVALSEWSGHNPEALHEAFKRMFLPCRTVSMPGGKTVEILGSTAALDTKAFAEYLDKVILFAAENGVYIPAPGEIVEVI